MKGTLFVLFLAKTFSVYADTASFTLTAVPEGSSERGNTRCLGYYAPKNLFVKVEYDAGVVENQKLNVEVFDTSKHQNKYFSKASVSGTEHFVFTTHENSNFLVCFSNYLLSNQPGMQGIASRDIKLTILTGAEALDNSAIDAHDEHLKPVDLEIRRHEMMMRELTDEMEYIKQREEAMRDTNEEILTRITNFSVGVMLILVCLGIWQVVYLRKFFLSKKLI